MTKAKITEEPAVQPTASEAKAAARAEAAAKRHSDAKTWQDELEASAKARGLAQAEAAKVKRARRGYVR